MWTILLKGNAQGQQKWTSLGTHNDNGEKSNAYIKILLKASDFTQWCCCGYGELSLILLTDTGILWTNVVFDLTSLVSMGSGGLEGKSIFSDNFFNLLLYLPKTCLTCIHTDQP